ncbi:MAG: CHASE domain-containing protein [Rhodocyclales bacterium]|nr:CHASE domain-containing protein [Rhodocyclales bacterium]
MSEFPNLFSRKFLAAWAVLALSLAGTLVGWQYAVRLTEARAQAQLDAAANAVVSEIRRRMTAYEQVLHAGAALFAASDRVTRAEWRDFVTHLKIDEHFPGIQGIGFARRIAPTELAAHVRAVRAGGFPGYTVRPEGAREIYTAVIYLEPFGGRNLRAFGFDMFSEPVRREAMLRACDTANAALSGKVTLVQETERDVQAGFLLYVPVYAKVSPRNTAAERRAALAGWAYAPFRMNDFMRAFVDPGASIVDVDIFDGAAVDAAALLFDLDEARGFRQPPPALWQRQDVLDLAGHSWTLAFRPRPAFAAGLDATPHLILAGGVFISLLLFAIAAGLATTRERAYALAGRLNRELRQSHDELESKVAERTAEIEHLLDASPMVIAYLVERRIVKVNRVVEALTGYVPKELLGQTTRCLYFNEEDYEAAGSALRAQLAETGRAQLDMRLRRKNGNGIWARFHARLLDARDPARGAIYLAEDITEQRRSEAALQESNARFMGLVTSSPVGIFQADATSRTTYASPRLCEIVGRGEADILKGGWERVVHPSDRAEVSHAIRHALDTGENFFHEHRVLTSEGAVKWVQVQASPVSDAAGRPAGHVGTLTDITERKRAEEQISAQIDEIVRQNLAVAEANRARGEFLNTMRHELRTPLNAIIGFAELLAQGIPQPLPEAQRQYAQDILDAGEGLLKLVNEILLYNAGESGALQLELQPIEVKSFLAERLRGFERAAGGKRIALACEVADDLPRLLADPRHLRTIIDHLLDNAVKFTEEGGSVTLRAGNSPSPVEAEGASTPLPPRTPRVLPAARGGGAGGEGATAVHPLPNPPPSRGRKQNPLPSPIEGEGAFLPSPLVGEGPGERGLRPSTLSPTLPHQGGGSYMEISITDTGVGIAAEDLPRLFKPFTQLDAGLARKAAGTGMGLALAQRLARLHDGYIKIDSQPGRGSTFTVRLPWQPEAP